MRIHDSQALFPAHIREDGAIQTVAEHCRESAIIASSLLSGLGLGQTALLAGLLHDMGKMRIAFKEYIQAATEGKPIRRGSVNHTFAGVKYLLESFHETGETSSYTELASELVAYAVGAHHGLFDAVNEDGVSGFEHRRAYDNDEYNEAIQNYVNHCVGHDELRRLFHIAEHEIETIGDKIVKIPTTPDSNTANKEVMFYFGLLARLLLSAVIEGDRCSTARFMGTYSNEPISGNRRNLWQVALDSLERQLCDMPCETKVNQARHEISDACRMFADRPSGLYRLNVPTGGGKTLASLRFALAHARKWGKKHIFYIAPLISILEQNVDVIRKAVGDPDIVLEHHSNVQRNNQNVEELHQLELLEENWDAPIIVTTLVQFLNSLFAGNTSSVRRFHALTDSVIIIDEIQTVPVNMLSLFNLGMNYLSLICSSTVLLCSATQPRFEEVPHALKVSAETPVPYDVAIWKAFQRTHIQFAGNRRLEDIPTLVKQELTKTNALLVVCNKKSQAEMLCHRLQCDTLNCFHLSASMCTRHRRITLKKLFDAIEKSHNGGSKTICVSTQVIEAGVDISFDEVIRLCAGMDSVVQSAGRCNRNGEYPFAAPVLLVNCENENLTGLEAIRRGKKATNSLLFAFEQSPERFDGDLASFESIDYYYRTLYRDIISDGKNCMDYPVNDLKTTLLDLLSLNPKFASDRNTDYRRYILWQAFKTAGGRFTVFDSNTVDVIVPWEGGKGIIEKLMRLDTRWQLRDIHMLLKEARNYTVSLYAWQVEKLSKQGALIELCDGEVLALTDGFYSDDTGLMTGRLTNGFLEV